MATTFRVQLTTAILAVLNAQKTATPTLLRAVYARQPGAFNEGPIAYIGARREGIALGGSIMQRTMDGLTVIVADQMADASQASNRMDVLVDHLVARFAAAYAQIPGGNSLLQLNRADDTDIALTGSTGSVSVYAGCVLTFGTTFMSEGRT